ncbi:MAG TPA: hypothetical protein VKV20_02155 [Ktedonobacteraceae bacterium]|jgi:hypothetical protein|nr:hypothetical protein [Ktedonobacteraceae bacterium]
MHLTFADITLPLWLFAAQWVLLFALGFLILVMFRQIALFERLKDSGSEREGLPVGEKAPSFVYQPVNRRANPPAHFEPVGNWSLLLFADPSCSSCQSTLLSLERLAPRLAQSMRLLVATTAEPAVITAADAFRQATVEIGRIPVDVSTRLYRTTVTPFGYLIDPDGIVRAKGAVADDASLRKLVRQGDQTPVNVEFTIS